MKTDYKTDQKFKTKRDQEQLNRHQQDAKRSILTTELSIKLCHTETKIRIT